ncbi:MAG: class I SAM-dependent methyltransferase, partial [Ignavibacteriaceae bacterium]|nr:class I SAM-dependent methyltransferase [Ignavibacteriaceae bacterium]
MANKEFYRFAKAYDIAFSGKDYKEEIRFIDWCFIKHAKVGSSNRSALELACGPARHAIELSRTKWKTYAIDLSSDMIEYAEILAKKEKADISFICGDMLDYKLDEPTAITTIFTESITHILTNEDLIKHLKCVSANMLPGGLYIIETAHP